MKKLSCLLLCLVFVLVGCLAAAEAADTRIRAVSMQGEEEEINEKLYVSPFGYEIWYDVDAVKLNTTEEDGYDEFVPRDPDALPPVVLSIVSAVVTDDEADALLDEVAADHRESGWDMGEIGEEKLDSGITCKACQGIKEGVVVKLYNIIGEKGVYFVTATYPEEATEGYGARLDIMVKTIVG